MGDIENNDGPETGLSTYEVLKSTREMIKRLGADAELSKVMEELGDILIHPQHPLYLIPASESLDKKLLEMREVVEGDLLEFHEAHNNFKSISDLSAEKKKLITSVATRILEDIKAYEVKAQESAIQILEGLITDKTYDKYREEVAEALGLGICG